MDKEQQPQTCEYALPEWIPGMALAYFLFDASLVSHRVTEDDLKYWQDWRVRGNC
jgi:hypothetical protein